MGVQYACPLIECGSQQEGLAALWTGLGPNIARNAIINAAELASYDQVKEVKFSCFYFSMELTMPFSLYSILW